MCWKVMRTKHEFQTMFANLGNSRAVSEELIKGLEEYVCNLYGSKEVDINKTRYKVFQRRYTRENKIIDLSLLPPCKDTLSRHIKRANTIAYIWKNSPISMVELLDTSTCGWTACSEIDWMNVPFPEDVKDVLVNDLEGVDDIYGYDEESDLEDI